jgi:3-hydroxyisobutyrate dehydrogenase-like beta-hydroxyacid dehydrogenase
VANLGNSTPDQAREPAAWVTGHGATYPDGATTALPETVATPEGFFLYSGSRQAVTGYQCALEVMSPAHYFGTHPGAAEVHDPALHRQP